MSNYLEITPNGLKHYELSPEKVSRYKTKKLLGKACVIDRETKESVFEGTTKEVDDFYYTETPVDVIWSKLRSACRIHKDATLGDLYRIIDDDDNLQFIIQCFYPFHDTMTISLHGETPIEIGVNRQVNIDHSSLSATARTTGIISPDNSCSKLIFTPNTSIFVNGKNIGNAPQYWSFLEVLDALFGQGAPRQPITIKKDKFEVDGIIPTQSIMAWIMGSARIEPNVTLQDIFNLVKKDELLKTFISEYSWCSSIDEIHEASSPTVESPSMTELRIHDRATLKTNYFNINCDISGIGPVDESSAKAYLKSTGVPEFETYSISASPVNEIANLPVKTASSYLFVQDLNKRISYHRPFSLLEILDAIYWEISFYGSPTDRPVISESIERIEEIKAQLD